MLSCERFDDLEGNRLVMRIAEEQKVAVPDRLAAGAAALDRPAGEEHSDAPGEFLVPVVVGHLAAFGGQPDDLLVSFRGHGVGAHVAAAAEDRVLAPQQYHAPREFEELLASSIERPVEPRELVVLAIGVVVALLRATELITPEHHRHALREQQ